MDKVSSEKRSETMRAVRSKNTGLEMRVRRLLHHHGYRYRLHKRDLPGKPDLVFAGRRKAIFVHGCFWHGHDCRPKIRPTSNTDYWTPKINGNRERDARNVAALEQAGWQVFTMWECQSKDEAALLERLKAFLD